MKLNCRAERHHYSMFNVGRSMFSLFCLMFIFQNNPIRHKCNLRMLTKQLSAYAPIILLSLVFTKVRLPKAAKHGLAHQRAPFPTKNANYSLN